MLRDTRPLFLVVITLMGSVGLLATDIYLPALPEMAVHFNCNQVEIQTSFTLFLLGLAFCQLVYGSLADRFGRKKVTLFGLTLFIIATLLCAMAETLNQFLLFRLLQAMGGGVGSVVNRAIIADKYNKLEATKVFSTIFPIIGLSAAIGPWIGGYLTYFASWRSVFYFMAGFGALVWLLVLFFLKESRKVDVEDTPSGKFNFSKHVQGYLAICRNTYFLGYAFIICASFSAFRCFSVESPFVFDNQGYVADEIGSFYLALSMAYVIGNLMAKRLVSSMVLDKVINIGFILLISGSVCMLISSLYFEEQPYAVILPMAIITLGNGFLFPTSSAGAMSSVETTFSGRASGLMGAMQFTTAAIFINWIGKVCEGEAFSMAAFIGGIILLGLLCYRFLVQKPKIESDLNLVDRDL